MTVRATIPLALFALGSLTVIGCSLHKKDDSPPPPSTTFTFSAAPATSYTRIDRVGMPGVATATITNKDAYNNSDPSDDVAGTWVPQITANVTAVHTSLDSSLVAAGLTPATTSQSISQAAPLIVPDTLKIDTTMAPGFPNGRQLTDPVMDITLAVVLLHLGVNGQTASTLANLPLNPPANDVPFNTNFPYLASPH